MAYIVPVKTKEPDMFYAEDGHLVKMVEHYAQGEHEYEIVHYYDKDGNEVEARYSVRSIIREVRELGKYDQFRAFLESAKFDWDFVGANYLAATDPDFVRMCEGIIKANIISREELDALLPKCIWTAE